MRVIDAPAAVNYGLDRVRFPSPVASGAIMRAVLEVIDVREQERGVLLTSRVTMTADGADRAACVAESLTLYPGGRLR
jgi:acyl dehydratase